MTVVAELVRHPSAPVDATSKCASEDAAGSPAVKCEKPGQWPRCQLCPHSPTYWRIKIEGAGQ